MRRARLMVGLCLLGWVFGTIYAIFYWIIGHYGGVAVIFVCVSAMVFIPFFVRATGRVKLAANLSVLTWALGFVILTAIEGGIHGHAIAWLACGVPLIALLILDRSEALFWCGFCFVATLIFCALELAHISLRPVYPEKWRHVVTAAGYMGLAVFMTLLGMIFEYGRKQAFLGMQGALEDLSGVNERLHKSERFVQRIADTMPGLIYMLDLEQQSIVYANKRLLEVLGFSSGDDLRITVRDWKPSAGMPDLERIFQGASRRIRGVKDGVFIETEYQFVQDSRETHWVCRDTVFSRGANGEPRFVLGIAEDVTEQRRIENAKRIAEGANRAKDEFLALLSHELRTPLTPVLVTVAELELQGSLPPELRQDISMVRRNVELEAKLIDDLLDVTRISSGKLILNLGIVDAHSSLQSALEICRGDIEAKEIQVTLELKAEQYHISADPVRLRQVFWNLLRNAVKFTPREGRITLHTTNSGGKLRIQISDTGVGMEPEVLPRIFNAFEQGEQARTRRFGGLGLGLSIAKAVVDMHQGTITAWSEGKDKGATFTVEFAAVAAPAGKPAPLLNGVAAPSPEKLPRILLVEDDKDTLSALSKLLRRYGYEVAAAESVKKGRELAAREKFDLLVSDLGLPDGSGLELMREIKALYGIPGIALSGYGADEDLRLSRAAGFSEHIIKPVHFETLRTAIRRVMAA
ncbi:MAG: ATP-binding protein [Verrucomicrobia bacterium]|nr:ATP-binding protein [Verrucomicrobiota bacterium]